MKPSIASFLSISAIVVAGGAALAVNATVFEAPSTAAATDSPEVLAVAASGEQLVTSEVAVGELGSQDLVIIDDASPTTTAVASDVATAALSEYEIPGVGVVTVSQTGSVITIDNVTTKSGYTYSTSEPFPGRLDVRFTSSTSEIEFDAQLIDGRIITVVKSRALNSNSVSGTKSASRTEHDDDEDEHDESHEAEHEDEHDEDDDD